MTRAGSAQPAGKDFSLIGDETAQRAVVLVVDPAHSSLAKGTALLWSTHCHLILVVVVIVAASRRLQRNLFVTQGRSADFVLVERDEVTNDAFVELERALVFRQNRRLRCEARDYVVAVFLGADGVGELAPSPMARLRLLGAAE